MVPRSVLLAGLVLWSVAAMSRCRNALAMAGPSSSAVPAGSPSTGATATGMLPRMLINAAGGRVAFPSIVCHIPAGGKSGRRRVCDGMENYAVFLW